MEMIDTQIEDAANRFLADDYGAASFAEWVGQRLGVELTRVMSREPASRTPRKSPRPGPSATSARRFARPWTRTCPRMSTPPSGPGRRCANWANNRFELNLKEKDLRKFARADSDEFQFGHADLEEFLNEKAVASIQTIDLSPAREFLLPDWGRRSLGGWAHHKFGMAIDPANWADLDKAEIVRRIKDEARQIYAKKEAELPARIALMRYMGDRAGHQPPRYDREGLAAWAMMRYQTPLDGDELRSMLRPEIESRLMGVAEEKYAGAPPDARTGRKARGCRARGVSRRQGCHRARSRRASRPG